MLPVLLLTFARLHRNKMGICRLFIDCSCSRLVQHYSSSILAFDFRSNWILCCWQSFCGRSTIRLNALLSSARTPMCMCVCACVSVLCSNLLSVGGALAAVCNLHDQQQQQHWLQQQYTHTLTTSPEWQPFRFVANSSSNAHTHTHRRTYIQMHRSFHNYTSAWVHLIGSYTVFACKAHEQKHTQTHIHRQTNTHTHAIFMSFLCALSCAAASAAAATAAAAVGAAGHCLLLSNFLWEFRCVYNLRL